MSLRRLTIEFSRKHKKRERRGFRASQQSANSEDAPHKIKQHLPATHLQEQARIKSTYLKME